MLFSALDFKESTHFLKQLPYIHAVWVVFQKISIDSSG